MKININGVKIAKAVHFKITNKIWYKKLIILLEHILQFAY